MRNDAGQGDKRESRVGDVVEKSSKQVPVPYSSFTLAQSILAESARLAITTAPSPELLIDSKLVPHAVESVHSQCLYSQPLH